MGLVSTLVCDPPTEVSPPSNSTKTVLSTKELRTTDSPTDHPSVQSPAKPLALNDWLLVEACLETLKKYGHVDRIEAYRKIHPNVTYNSAKALVWRRFTNVALQEAIELRIKADHLSKESVMSVLWGAVESARVKGQDDTVITGCVNTLKAMGEWVEKSERKVTDDPHTTESIRSVVRKYLPVGEN